MKNVINEQIILKFKLLAIKDRATSLYFYVSQRIDHQDAKEILRPFIHKLINTIQVVESGCVPHLSLKANELIEDWSKNISPKIAPNTESIFVEECFEILGMLRHLNSSQ